MNKWSEEIKGLSTLDISCKRINALEAQGISQALENNTTLTAIYLKENKIGTEGAKYFSKALQSNQTLEVIDLRNNHIGPKGAKRICEALKSNTTLTSINLKGNPTGRGGFEHFKNALARNFTILVLHIETEFPRTYSRSPYSPASRQKEMAVLNSYLERNKQIAQCLQSITNFDTNLPDNSIEECIEKLNAICCKWNVSSKDHPCIAECQKLLIALKNLNSNKTKEDALRLLALKFTHPLFERAANLAIVQFLFKNIFPNLRDSQQHVALSQVLLYKLKQHLQEPAMQEVIYSALNLLPCYDKKQTSPEDTIVLNYDTLLRVTRRALIKCKSCHPANEEEADLLISVLKHADYHPALITYLLQSPSFVNEFKERFPGKSFFVPVENCLLPEKKGREFAKLYSLFFSPLKTSNFDDTHSYLIALPAQQLPAVTREQVQRCKTEICKLNPLYLDNPMQNFEEILAKILHGNFFEEWNQDTSGHLTK